MIVILDIGSTLIDGPPIGPARRIAEALGLGREHVPELERLLFCTAVCDADQLGFEVSARMGVDAALAVQTARSLWDAQLREAFVLPGAREAIDSLKAAGVPRAYLSNIWPPFYQRFAREFAEEAAECPQFLSFRTGLMKPDAAFFRLAMNTLGVQASDAVVVGDTYDNDILPAIELGMRTVWVLHRPAKERDALVRVLNGSAPKPEFTRGSIGELANGILWKSANTSC
ncbi:MAG TPA: HAD-IA family hydrolase [Bryobacteraceae bacterium]|nr:HAD-IA family hydrolase [Bryobacteraceae bacterium]